MRFVPSERAKQEALARFREDAETDTDLEVLRHFGIDWITVGGDIKLVPPAVDPDSPGSEAPRPLRSPKVRKLG